MNGTLRPIRGAFPREYKNQIYIQKCIVISVTKLITEHTVAL